MTKGYILEASPLPKLPVTALESVTSNTQKSFSVCLDYQSAEDEAVNGTENRVEFRPIFPRYPFILLLDGIVSILFAPRPSSTLLRTEISHSSTPVTSAPSCVPHSFLASMPWPSPPGTPRRSLPSHSKHPRGHVNPCPFFPSPTLSNSSTMPAAKVGKPTQQWRRSNPTSA